MKEVDARTLKRLNINMNNIFPLKLDDVQPSVIKNKLFSSLLKTKEPVKSVSSHKVFFMLFIHNNYFPALVIESNCTVNGNKAAGRS